jgi:hypothetical protein
VIVTMLQGRPNTQPPRSSVLLLAKTRTYASATADSF